MRRVHLFFVFFVSVVIAPASVMADTILIQHATVHTLGHEGTLVDASIVVKDGYIAAVGKTVSVPKNARVIDAKGLIVTPGIMNANTYLGLSEIKQSLDSNDHSGKDSSLGATFNVSYGLNYRSDVILENRRHGLTHALSSPTDSNDLFIGSGVFISLTGDKGSFIQPGPMVINLEAAGNRNAAWGRLNRVFAELKHYAKTGKIEKTYLPAFEMDALLPVIKGEQFVLLTVKGVPDIRQAIAMKKAYGFKMALVEADEAWLVAKELKEADIAVLVEPRDTLPRTFADLHSSGRNAAILVEAGVQTIIAPTGTGRNHQAHHVLEAAGVAVRYGLPWEEALKAITKVPAQLFGLKEYGAIERGKVATLVIWDGDPLEVTTNPTHVFVLGKAQPLVSHRTALRDKYLKP
ncbi:amidohydrolase family protein [Kordiimonas pumila]|uniref:Amidohydrolase family protein n=1 Tax=Kordiimonas pumila TaxID=2161677 RepID=A0ABV7D5N2_9PROT|nr:amidohydrolase family protein [Kordiimonas pumila]